LDQKHPNSLPERGKWPDTGAQFDDRRLGKAQPGSTHAAMRVLFWTWIVLITAGLVFYSVVGLSHH
jgi:hypothetical protein